jgi:hypothetical protein
MSTLTQPALSMLIDRLFAEADAAEKARSAVTRASDRSDYRRYYGLLKDQPLPVSRATGKLLYMLARSARARTIIECGTSFGISTLHLAAALQDNGGGQLIGSEFEPSKARKPWRRRLIQFRGNSRGRCTANARQRFTRLDRFCFSRWGEESLFTHTLIA